MSNNDDDEKSVSSTSSSEADDEALKALEDALVLNPGDPNSYSAHVTVIRGLKEAGELDRLRAARERLSAHFPLSETLWTEWLQDEISLVKLTGKDKIVTLFQTATQDYLSVDIWKLYINFANTHLGKDEAENVMRTAVDKLGYHFSRGHEIWEILNKSEIQDEELNRRRLFAPIDDSHEKNETLAKFVKYEVCPFEEKLSKYKKRPAGEAGATNEMIGIWLDYISSVMSKERKMKKSIPELDFKAWCQCLYERAIASCCLSSDIWERYLHFTLHVVRDKDNSLFLREVQRAVGNVPSESKFWKLLLRGIEMQGLPFSDLITQVGTVQQRMMCCTFASESHYIDILLSACDVYRRLAMLAQSDEKKSQLVNQLDAQFEYARNLVETSFASKDAVRYVDVLSLYTSTLTNPQLFDQTATINSRCSKLWVKSIGDFPDCIELYEAGVRFHRQRGSLDECRTLLKKGLHHFRSGNNTISAKTLATQWIELETRSGSLQSLVFAEKSVGSLLFMEKYKVKKRKVVKRKREEADDDDKTKKEESPEKKRLKAQRREAEERERSVFVLNLSFKATSDDISEHFTQIGPVEHVKLNCRKNGRSKGSATVCFKSGDHAKLALERLNESVHLGRVLQLSTVQVKSKKEGEKAALNNDETYDSIQRSVFVSKLPAALCTAENIRSGEASIFKALRDIGKIDQVKIARNKTSAIIRFKTEDEATKALELHRQKFDDEEIYVEEVKSKYTVEEKKKKGGVAEHRRVKVGVGAGKKRKKKVQEEGKKEISVQEGNGTMKSNDFFSSLFKKK